MATSSADAVLGPAPRVGHGHEGVLALIGVLAVVAVFIAAILLDPGKAGGPDNTTPLTTSPTYQPAPPVHRIGPAVPAFAD